MNIKTELEKTVGLENVIQLNDVDLNPQIIRAVLINEIVPQDPSQDFYGSSHADYLSTTIPLFREAGLSVTKIQDLLDIGIYITNAVKIPKTGYTVENSALERSLPYLEQELSLFPQLQVILLMGDVAKKAFNKITKKTIKKNIVPAISTYKLRNTELYYGDIRILPSYIMTGKNILIEKSKFAMAAEDIALMLKLIQV
ncbi:uracil-DNA glycosylase family protein [Holdemania massiliensis]|uniref:uracil-DNA glycosylase family protein n=1 Tax=Holdemania massiliensis TaxID=1468449 RepID=UPI001F06FFE3|nr:uracil-DNA glycosylase family protein [Holdemania massiliensis]MCH1939633.1 uracil-DNA glycosylase family protein [Holdemania massiliensis]